MGEWLCLAVHCDTWPVCRRAGHSWLLPLHTVCALACTDVSSAAACCCLLGMDGLDGCGSFKPARRQACTVHVTVTGKHPRDGPAQPLGCWSLHLLQTVALYYTTRFGMHVSEVVMALCYVAGCEQGSIVKVILPETTRALSTRLDEAGRLSGPVHPMTALVTAVVIRLWMVV